MPRLLALLAAVLAFLLLTATSASADDKEAERNARDRARLAQVTEQWRSAERDAASFREKALAEARAASGRPTLRTESELASALERSDRAYDHLEEISIRLGVPLPDRAAALAKGAYSPNDALSPLVARARTDLARAFRAEARAIARKVKFPTVTTTPR